jgi:hypothetical protein
MEGKCTHELLHNHQTSSSRRVGGCGITAWVWVILFADFNAQHDNEDPESKSHRQCATQSGNQHDQVRSAMTNELIRFAQP